LFHICISLFHLFFLILTCSCQYSYSGAWKNRILSGSYSKKVFVTILICEQNKINNIMKGVVHLKYRFIVTYSISELNLKKWGGGPCHERLWTIRQKRWSQFSHCELSIIAWHVISIVISLIERYVLTMKLMNKGFLRVNMKSRLLMVYG
jgi:hypothetical protein